jgi:predicted ATPase/class 3 adenylate cyclase
MRCGSRQARPALDRRSRLSHDRGVPNHLPTGTVTFLFTDIEGSTQLLRALGADYRAVLERHAEIVRQALATHGGIEVGTEGDAFFAVFESAVDAVAAAVAAQRGLAMEPWPIGHPVRVRMGLHTGEGQLGGDSYVGLDVHRAARIAAAANGGQVLLSAATRALIEPSLPAGVALRDLGPHALKDLAEPEDLAQLSVDGLQTDYPSVRSLETPSSLPGELTSFIGRQREIDEASRLLDASRLLTLTGPGGTGKTRLALRIAAGRTSTFRDGVFFIDLAPLTDPGLVTSSVARGLNLSEEAGRPIVDVLRTYLERRELLLVLDNFEHVLSANALVKELLAAAPHVKVLATSRTILNLYGEQEFEVPPLDLPDLGAATDASELANAAAVALFIARAQAVKPSFAVSLDGLRSVAEICIRLDGLPLAIELAASRVRMLEPSEILARLEAHLPVLGTGGTDLPPRQRTLTAAIEWSYGLLPPAERALFARLAVFAGGCTLDAGDAVCNPEGELGIDTLDGIASLVQQSLVQARSAADASRFGMLETIREFGRDRLRADDGSQETGRRHLDFFRDLAESAEPHFLGPDRADWLDRFEREHANIRAALTLAVDVGDAEDGQRLAAALWRFWFQRGHLREGVGWLEAVLALEPDAISAARGKAYTALGGLAYWLLDVDRTENAYEAALHLYRTIGDRGGEAEALYNRSFVPSMRADAEETRRRLEDSLAAALEIGRGDLAAHSRASLGVEAVRAGESRAGLALELDALAFFRGSGDLFKQTDILVTMAMAHRALHEPSLARAAYLESIRLSTDTTNLPGIGVGLVVGAAVESADGRHLDAIRMIGAAEALRMTTEAASPQMPQVIREVDEAARQAIGDGSVDEALGATRRMTVDQVIAFAGTLASE